MLASPLLVGSQRALASASATRTLSFLHTHTGETLSVAYAQGTTYVAAALARVNWLLRDFRNDEVLPIDPQLLDQLHAVTALTGSKAPFEVISGYRSPATNEALRKRGDAGGARVPRACFAGAARPAAPSLATLHPFARTPPLGERAWPRWSPLRGRPCGRVWPYSAVVWSVIRSRWARFVRSCTDHDPTDRRGGRIRWRTRWPRPQRNPSRANPSSLARRR